MRQYKEDTNKTGKQSDRRNTITSKWELSKHSKDVAFKIGTNFITRTVYCKFIETILLRRTCAQKSLVTNIVGMYWK